MKLKNKIKLIQNELTSEMQPLDFKNILSNAQIAPILENKHKTKILNIRFKTALTTILLLAIVIPIAIFSTLKPIDDTKSNNDLVYETIEEVYAFVATSAVALAYSSNDIFKAKITPYSNDNLLVYEELGYLNRLLVPIEMMLSYDRNFTALPSDYPLFRNKIEYRGEGIDGEVILYDIYFNETLISSIETRIDCIVNTGEELIFLYGNTKLIDNKTILTMTYYLDNEDIKNYIQVSKNLIDNTDSYNYLIVKDNVEVSKHKLTFNKNKEKYATLKNLLATDKITTFNIYKSKDYDLKITYEIFSNTQHGEYGNATPGDDLEETGNINVIITQSTSSFIVNANNSTNIINFDKPK